MNQFIDSHCHLDFPAFEPIRMQEMADMHQAGVVACVVPGVTADTWGRLQQLADSEAAVFPAYGLHPYFLSQHQRRDLALLEQQLATQPAVAVGEFGLDYYLTELDRDEQQFYFDAQLSLAKQCDLPVILHVRKAHDQVLKALRQAQLPRGGVIHAYSGSEQQARQYIELGFMLGFGGSVTYDRALKLRSLLQRLPLESILLETDAPDMPPSFVEQGQINKPSYLPQIASCVQAVIEKSHSLSLSALAEQTSRNADRLFGLGFYEQD